MSQTPQSQHDATQGDARAERPPERDVAQDQQALIERARQLGATAEELEVALDALALQAEAVLHRLRGGPLQ